MPDETNEKHPHLVRLCGEVEALRLTLAVLILLYCSYATGVHAQCPGENTVVAYGVVAMSSMSSGGFTDTLDTFIGTGCTTAMFGTMAPIICQSQDNPSLKRLTVAWSFDASNTTGNGCTFNCQGGTCRIRGGDALPVELMDFGIEVDDGPDAESEAPEGIDEKSPPTPGRGP